MITVREKVRFVETDMMGVAHHSNHLRWFEMGRVEYLRKGQVNLWDLMEKGIVFPITEVECKYKNSILFDDYILVETKLAMLTRAQMVFTYRVVREKDGLLMATGRTQNVFTNKETGGIIRLDKDYLAPLFALYEEDKEG